MFALLRAAAAAVAKLAGKIFVKQGAKKGSQEAAKQAAKKAGKSLNQGAKKCVTNCPKAAGQGAYEAAKQGGKHAGYLKNYANKSTAEIKKAVDSQKKLIAEHRDKIANPEKHIPDFKKLDPRQQENLINKKWPSDIQRQSEQLDILEGILKSRGN